MIIRNLFLEGYGTFLDRALELDGGLQVVMGPNEQGKSTLRAFICEMLYGQRPEDGVEGDGEQRRPWMNPDKYGGQMVYELADGRRFRVERRFGTDQPAVAVIDVGSDTDVTGQFRCDDDGMPLFADLHLGVPRRVFVSSATISHFSLDHLGDGDALAELREHVLPLAESGVESRSVKSILALLDGRIMQIGRADSKTRPLPAGRARLVELADELRAARELRSELIGVVERRQTLFNEAQQASLRRDEIERRIAAVEGMDLAMRLDRAEQIQSRIDNLTQRCFELSGVRDFPIADGPELHRAATVAATARMEVERSHKERSAIEEQLSGEGQPLVEENPAAVDFPLDEWRERWLDTRAQTESAEARLTEAEERLAAADEQLEENEERLKSLPDFSRVAADPVTWFTQLGSSFHISVRLRDEERERLNELEAKIAHLEDEVSGPTGIFEDCSDFGSMSREYEFDSRLRREQLSRLSTELESLELSREEYGERVPALRTLAILTSGLLVGWLLIQWYFQQQGNYVAGLHVVSALLGVATSFFYGSMVYARSRSTGVTKVIERLSAEVDALHEQEAQPFGSVEKMMVEAKCETVRELAALFDAYKDLLRELKERQAELQPQRMATEEAEERVTTLLERLTSIFADVQEEVKEESEVEEAVSKAIAKYHEYRDAKRRTGDSRDRMARYRREAEELSQEVTGLRGKRDELAASLVEELGAVGLLDTEEDDTTDGILKRAERKRSQMMEDHARKGVLTERLEALVEKAEEEEERCREAEARLEDFLSKAGVGSVEAWEEKAERAGEYEDIWSDLKSLERELDTLLEGEALDHLRRRVAESGFLEGSEAEGDVESLRNELDAVNAEIEAKVQEDHSLHIELTERALSGRPLNEIEEEMAVVGASVKQLEEEAEAASRAMALLEEEASKRYAAVAPRLTQLSGDYLRSITGGAYGELSLDEGLGIHVRAPQTGEVLEAPGEVLSKGTLDQIYLAIRLGLVNIITGAIEPVPMLLDDPFANYDDKRLWSAMELLSHIGETNQVILFTCREDVLRAAQGMNASVIQL